MGIKYDKIIMEAWKEQTSQIKEIQELDLYDDNYSKNEIWSYICSLKNQIKILSSENEMLTIDKNLLIKMLKNPEQFIDGMYVM